MWRSGLARGLLLRASLSSHAHTAVAVVAKSARSLSLSLPSLSLSSQMRAVSFFLFTHVDLFARALLC